MEIIANTTEFHLECETAVAIGKFDGIHIGHRKLLDEILAKKAQGLKACIFTFDPPPAVLFGRNDDVELTTREEKRILFERLGVDILIEFPLSLKTAAIEPEIFVRQFLAEQMKARFIVAGTDLSFGAKGAGNAALLQKMGSELGFAVKTIEKVCVDDEEVSSTRVRKSVENGDMKEAEKLLGMPYLICGTVVRGNKIGRTIGFPTVNIVPAREKLLPPYGVYFSKVMYDNKMYRAISNVGCKPTVNMEPVCNVETYLYDFEEDIYDKDIEVYLYEFRRPERKFESIEDLKKQLEDDCKAGEKYLF